MMLRPHHCAPKQSWLRFYLQLAKRDISIQNDLIAGRLVEVYTNRLQITCHKQHDQGSLLDEVFRRSVVSAQIPSKRVSVLKTGDVECFSMAHLLPASKTVLLRNVGLTPGGHAPA